MGRKDTGEDSAGSAGPVVMDMCADVETAGGRDRRFLFSGSAESKDVWVVRGWRLSRVALLVPLCLLLALFCLLLVVWVGVLISAAESSSSDAGGTACHQLACLQQATRMVSIMNSSVDPCSDFYQYACGRFNEVNPLGIRFAYDTSNVLEEANQRRVEQLLQHRHRFDEKSAISKIRVLYQSCVQAAYGSSSTAGFSKVVKSLGGWDLFNNFEEGQWDFSTFFVKTREHHRLLLFFGMMWQSANNQLQFTAPRFAANMDIFSESHPAMPERLSKYRSLIISIMTRLRSANLLAENDACGLLCQPEHIADDIISMESQVVGLWRIESSSPNPTKMFLEGLITAVPSLPWRRLLSAIHGKTVLKHDMTINAPSMPFLVNLDSLIKQSNSSTLNNYIMWALTRQYLVAMGPSYAADSQELDALTFGTLANSRQQICYNVIAEYMPLALRALLVQEHIGVDNIPAVRSLYQTINASTAASFTWMTPEARENALQFLSKIGVDFGVSPLVTSEDKLNQYYRNLNLSHGNFFESIVAADSFRATEAKQHVKKLSDPGASEEIAWVSGRTSKVAVTYDSATETLRIPFGSLQVPFFNRDLPDHLNMAAMGTHVLRILALPFYISKRKNLPRATWDQTTSSKFDRYKRCLLDNFRDYHIEVTKAFQYRFSDSDSGLHTSGMTRLDPLKASSYLTSKHIAFLMAEIQLSRLISPEHSVLPGVQASTSPEKQFYLTYAQTHCQTLQPSVAVMFNSALRMFPHSQMVNNFFYNSPGFMKTFGCRAPPKQHAAQTCSLWQ